MKNGKCTVIDFYVFPHVMFSYRLCTLDLCFVSVIWSVFLYYTIQQYYSLMRACGIKLPPNVWIYDFLNEVYYFVSLLLFTLWLDFLRTGLGSEYNQFLYFWNMFLGPMMNVSWTLRGVRVIEIRNKTNPQQFNVEWVDRKHSFTSLRG